MFWFFYILSAVFLSAGLVKERKRIYSIYVCLVFLLTPAQIEIGTSNYAPSLFTFFFNLVFLEEYSLRVLRPLFLTLPISLFFYLFLRIKKYSSNSGDFLDQ